MSRRPPPIPSSSSSGMRNLDDGTDGWKGRPPKDIISRFDGIRYQFQRIRWFSFENTWFNKEYVQQQLICRKGKFKNGVKSHEDQFWCRYLNHSGSNLFLGIFSSWLLISSPVLTPNRPNSPSLRYFTDNSNVFNLLHKFVNLSWLGLEQVVHYIQALVDYLDLYFIFGI
jgi:hypothetical protein